MKTIKVKKEGRYYIAEYTTLDLITQGTTRERALLNLLEIISVQIDFAVENDNLVNILPQYSVTKKD